MYNRITQVGNLNLPSSKAEEQESLNRLLNFTSNFLKLPVLDQTYMFVRNKCLVYNIPHCLTTQFHEYELHSDDSGLASCPF